MNLVSQMGMSAAIVALLSAAAAAGAGNPGVVTILSTDLSLDKDVDDWFDTFLFTQSPALRPRGIVLEHYATDEVLAATRQFLALTGCPDIPVARGIQQELSGAVDSPKHGPFGDGADLILETMRSTPGKVRLIAVGSLRNEAVAYRRDPDLFLAKIDRLYFVGGTPDKKPECNMSRDLLAAEIVCNAPIPKVWVPCTADHKQKMTGEEERRIAEADNPAAAFLTEMLTRWREGRGEGFLDRTGQHEGKNLWSIPAILHAQKEGADWMTFVPGTLSFDDDRWMSFDQSADGPDLMMTTRRERPICEWVVDRVTGFVPRQRLKVFVLAGQSNMVGRRSRPENLPDDLRRGQRRALFFTGEDWIPLAPGVSEKEGFGPELSFAQTVCAGLDQPIGIIKHSAGGTSLAERWNPDNPKSLYAELVKKVRAAQASRPIEIVGMLWMQGERDSKDEAMAAAYASNLARLIQRARRDFDAPDMVFAAGRVNPPEPEFPFVNQVRKAQESCSVKGYAFVDCDDLPKGSDNLHYDTHGIVEMGRRFAAAVSGQSERQGGRANHGGE